MGVLVPSVGFSQTLQANFYERHNTQFLKEYYLVSLEEILDFPTDAIETKAVQTDDIHFVINIPPRKLTVYENGVATQSYPVTIGRLKYKTPLGPRKLSKLIWNPWWYPPDSEWAKDAKDTPPGPGNPLGKVKIPLGGPILLHGTHNPRSIGHAASHACMRMHNRDIIALATWLQDKFSDKSEDPLLKSHMNNWLRRSYEVPLIKTLALEITYNPVEVQGDNLILHPDIYRYRKDYYDDLKNALAKIGIEASDVDFDQLPEKLPKEKLVRIPILSILFDANDRLATCGEDGTTNLD
jgi:hypothetical protein